MESELQIVVLPVRERAEGAFLGAAVGDALGWPQEHRAGRVGRRPGPTFQFQQWQRRSGGRFMPHEEIIWAGEYSDDTQLLMCTARSLLKRRTWLRHFVTNEIPSWTVYQRGAGGATKRASGAWVSGYPPWSDSLRVDERKQYFEAGGNGVAMRVMPHVIAGGTADFRDLLPAILLNGICTHGHPRALIGAVVHAYILWVARRHSGTLPYGKLAEAALDNRRVWEHPPEFEGPIAQWKSAANQAMSIDIVALWKQTVDEMSELLLTAKRGIDDGALSIDEDVLGRIGCFDPKVNGAGTVCAAASLYLASRYAPNPAHGVLEAAFAKGADTDTLASMTGAILGMVTGTEWLLSNAGKLQDAKYLQDLAASLTESSFEGTDDSWTTSLHSRRNELKAFMEALQSLEPTDQVQLPDGRKATLLSRAPVQTRSKALTGTQWKLQANDGQTLYVKKLARPGRQTKLPLDEMNHEPLASTVQAVKVPVSNLERARVFYGDVLGLKIVRQSRNAVNFGGILTLTAADSDDFAMSGPNTSTICIVTSNLDACYDRVATKGVRSVSPISRKSGRRFFRCVDLDGNAVEIFEAVTRETSSADTQDGE